MAQHDVITKDILKDLEDVTVHFLDSEYTVNPKLIADVHFETVTNRRTGRITVTDGFIEFFPEISDLVGELLPNDEFYEFSDSACFLTRVTEGADIERIDFTSLEKDMLLYIPCKPLLACNGNIVEYSNCPSIELTASGCLRIYVGNSSKNPMRKRIYYRDVCKNWERLMGKNYNPDLLYGELLNIRVSAEEIGFEFEIINQKCPHTYVCFHFENYTIHSFNIYLHKCLSDDIEIKQMANGNLLLYLQESEVCLECKNVSVYMPD